MSSYDASHSFDVSLAQNETPFVRVHSRRYDALTLACAPRSTLNAFIAWRYG